MSVKVLKTLYDKNKAEFNVARIENNLKLFRKEMLTNYPDHIFYVGQIKLECLQNKYGIYLDV